MPKTPYPLRQKFPDLPEVMPAYKLDRASFAFRDRAKRKEFLSLSMVMKMARAIEEVGAPSTYSIRCSLKRMAAMLGIDVSTLCRRLGQFSASDGRWDDQRRAAFSAQKKAEAAERLKGHVNRIPRERKKRRCRDCDPSRPLRKVLSRAEGCDVLECGHSYTPQPPRRKKLQHMFDFFRKQSGYGQAHLYSQAMPDSMKPTLEPRPAKNTDAALMADAFGDEWFDRDAKGCNGWKSVHSAIWDPRVKYASKCECQSGQIGLDFDKAKGCAKCDGTGVLMSSDPMPDYGRVMLSQLILMGLEDDGVVQRTQEELAERAGMDVNTWAKYEDAWECLGMIRCVPGKVTRECSHCHTNFVGKCPTCGNKFGTVVDRDPHKIICLWIRMLDEEIADREWQRFQAAQQQVQEKAALRLAESLHKAVMEQWKGQDHSLAAFWTEMRRRLSAAKVDKSVRDALYPLQLE